MIRSFIAVELTEEIKERISILTLELNGLGLPLKTVNPANLHITLVFLGEADHAFLAGAKTAMDEAVTALRPFPVNFRGAGGFPSDSRPSVVWAGAEDAAGGLPALHAEIMDRLSVEAKDESGKGFIPHVTVARVKKSISRSGRNKLKEWIGKKKEADFGVMTVRKLSLFESRLTDKGAVHTPIYSSALR